MRGSVKAKRFQSGGQVSDMEQVAGHLNRATARRREAGRPYGEGMTVEQTNAETPRFVRANQALARLSNHAGGRGPDRLANDLDMGHARERANAQASERAWEEIDRSVSARHNRRMNSGEADPPERFKKGGSVKAKASKKFANGGITSNLGARVAAARARSGSAAGGVPARAVAQGIRPGFSTPNFQAAVASGATADNISGGIGRSGGRLGNVAQGPAGPGRTGGIMNAPAGMLPSPTTTPPPPPNPGADDYFSGGNKKGGLIKSKNKKRKK